MSRSDPAKRFRLDNKVAVVTGGTGILGSLYCRRLAEAGARVVIADLKRTDCVQLAEEIRTAGGDAQGMPVDLSEERLVVEWAHGIRERFGPVDVIVNNAAAKTPGFFAPLESFSLLDWNRVLAVNVTAMFLVVRELGTPMAERGRGSIINVSSIYGIVGPDQRIYDGSWYEEQGGAINTPLVYTVTKGAVVALTKYLATYWGHMGVRTNTLTPGGVYSGQNDTFTEKYGSRVPMGRMAEDEEMVGALLFLASDASSYVNGHNLVVDGGWTAW